MSVWSHPRAVSAAAFGGAAVALDLLFVALMAGSGMAFSASLALDVLEVGAAGAVAGALLGPWVTCARGRWVAAARGSAVAVVAAVLYVAATATVVSYLYPEPWSPDLPPQGPDVTWIAMFAFLFLIPAMPLGALVGWELWRRAGG